MQEPYRSSDDDRGVNEAEEEEPLPNTGFGQRIPTSPLFRPSNLRCVNTLSGHHSGIRAIAIQQRTNRVFTGSYDNTIKVWNLDGGSCEATLEGHSAWIRSLFCHIHEPLLFSGSDDGEIKVWRTDSHELSGGIQTDAGGILAICVDYDHDWLLAGCYDTSIQVFALPACDILYSLPGHRSAVRCLTIYNGCLISGSYDRTVKLWDLNDECKCIGASTCTITRVPARTAERTPPHAALPALTSAPPRTSRAPPMKRHLPLCASVVPRLLASARRLARHTRLSVGAHRARGHAAGGGGRLVDQGVAHGHVGADGHTLGPPRPRARPRMPRRSAHLRL